MCPLRYRQADGDVPMSYIPELDDEGEGKSRRHLVLMLSPRSCPVYSAC